MSANRRPFLVPESGQPRSWARGLRAVAPAAETATPFRRLAPIDRHGSGNEDKEVHAAAMQRVAAQERTLADQIERLNGLERELRRALVAAEKTHVEVAVDLALVVAEQLVRAATTLDVSTLVPLIHESVRQIGTPVVPVVHLSPSDYTALAESRIEGTELELTVVSDPELDPGDCVVETPELQIDGSIRARLDALRNELVRLLDPHGEQTADVA